MTAELLLGAVCPGCQAPGFGLCTACRVRLAEPAPHRAVPTPCPSGFPTTYSGGPYDDLLHAVIPAHKERQAWLLTAPLADRLATAVEELIMRTAVDGAPLVLVPVPSTAAAVRRRGRDATAAIAGSAVLRLRRDHDRPLTMIKMLRPVRRLADQSELTESERRRNLAGGYGLRRGLPRLPVGAQLILVDDLVTTGSSLTEACRAVRAAGLSVLGAAVVAATQRRHPSDDRAVRPSGGRVLDRG
ncbi:Predicted amidophosphoribosyltransferases [Microlunatus soli]|uniref:Predicted amidophosphoribosyltransferases n=1 Tax=Microlunatus soli TaxID=630515 RepID=A0A1H1N0Q4_9ACTN|nr:Predicted amidophosphoribosyltransferases [Microlunatus soli]